MKPLEVHDRCESNPCKCKEIPLVEKLFDQYIYSLTKYPMTGKEYFIAGYEAAENYNKGSVNKTEGEA